MSKGALSGLGTIRRDWSESSISQQKSSQPIPWDPTPPKTDAPARPLTGREARLKAIQAALDDRSPEAAQILTDSQMANKRPSLEPSDSYGPPAKKRRELPLSWQERDTLMKSSLNTAIRKSSDALTAASRSSKPLGVTSKQKVAPVFLSQEQTQILKLVNDGNSIFYTGSAGTGKSVLLREIIKSLRKKFPKTPDAVAVTASTGIAACNIGGVTIHSFAGIGLGIETAPELSNKIKKNRKAMTRWLRTNVLIIDEISMVDGDLFDKLSEIGRILRKNDNPFGGIQIIVTGDFFQLPPVTKSSDKVKFAFEAIFWSKAVQRTFNLTRVFRQSDQEFVNMLNEMRFGRLSKQSIAKFRSLSREIEYEDGLAPTELFPRREDVERSNSTRMSRLQTKQELFAASDGGTITDVNQRQKMLANFMAPQILALRVDAQVMLIKNVDEMLVNGSMGRVIRFADQNTYLTSHDDESSLGGGSVIGGGVTNGANGKKGKTAAVGKPMLYPVVEFILPFGGKRTVMVIPETWKVELPNGEVQVSRTQLPLILSWAMSIHKSQGQTLDRVKVDLGKVFEKGQAYVALSRATSLAGLQVLNFDERKVMAHPKVAEWSKTLETIDES